MAETGTTEAGTQDGFEGYGIETTAMPTGFLVFVVTYVGIGLALIAFWTLRKPKLHLLSAQEEPPGERMSENPETSPSPPPNAGVEMVRIAPRDALVAGPNLVEPSELEAKDYPLNHADTAQTSLRHETGRRSIDAANIRMTFPERTHISHSPDNTVEFLESPEFRSRYGAAVNAVPSRASAATTSRLQDPPGTENSANEVRKSAVRRSHWDPSAMRWKHRHPLGRVETFQRHVQNERHVQTSGEESSLASRSRTSWNSRPGSRAPSNKGMSDLANNILQEGRVEGEAEFYRQKYLQRSRSRRSFANSDASLMPPMQPDQVSPEDAADAHDPGRSLPSAPDIDGEQLLTESARRVFTSLGGLLDLANPDVETKRIFRRAIPPTIAAVVDPLYRLILAGLICHTMTTDSMVAFVLVSLLLRLTTEELSGAMADAEWTMINTALSQGGQAGFSIAGLYVQLSMIMQLLVGVPVMLMWVFVMEDIVYWLLSSRSIASLALDYTQVVVVDYLVQGVSRAFMLVFHLTDQTGLESTVDILTSMLKLATIAVVITTTAEPSLVTVGWIQVIFGIAQVLAKVLYVVVKGWVQPFRGGLLSSLSLTDKESVVCFVSFTIPLLIGSLVELREWELLTFFVRRLGGAEVATWALMGIVWEIFEATSEGIGEAAAVRVSYYLAENIPFQAQTLASKVIFWTLVEAVVCTSVFLMVGPNITVALTTDPTLQHLFSSLVGMTGFANLTMAFAQVYWSLVGSQGRFILASSTVLACRWLCAMPLAFLCIFAFEFDLQAVAASISVGYISAAVVLASCIVRSDWKQLAHLTRQESVPFDMDSPFDLSFDGEENDDSSSEYAD